MARRVRSGDSYIECPTVKLAAIALDYDGTIAVNGAIDPTVRAAIGEARAADDSR